ncbi:MAG: CAP domain-containing protein [Microthrixaceae bacterium]|nr:CAP domain-containing protein [Microthrixaceae bacterium]MCO5317175.1 CAP domain-containing protein [Microthrixaceae bacterium]
MQASPSTRPNHTKARRLVALAVLPLVAWLVTGCQGAEVARSIQLTNQAREARGTQPVVSNSTLQAKAQSWASVLASQGRLVHSNLAEGTGGGWRALGENLAEAHSVDEAHQLFMNSSAHRSTMLDGRYSQVGVGVAVRNGTYYVVQVFGG